MRNIDIKSLLKNAKNQTDLDLLLNQSNRVKLAILALLVWHNSKSEKFPAMVTGSSGSSKSFITVKLFEALLGKDSVKHIVPPSSGSYSDFIHSQIFGKHYKMIIIDESHKLDFDIETIQPHKKSLVIGETSINYGNLIFISHSGMGRNSSEDARLIKVEYGTPEREEIIDLLQKFEGMPQDKANWSAWHAPRNIHNAKSVSDKFATDLQPTVNPCGLLSQDLAVLNYYSEMELIGCNTISSCSGKLSLDVKAVQQSERRLKGEGFLVVGKQSKRDVTEIGKDLLYTLAGNVSLDEKSEAELDAFKEKAYLAEFDILEPTSKAKAKPKAKTPTSKPTAKPKAKTPKSKLDKVRPDKTPSEIMADIHSELDSKKVPDYYDNMDIEDLTSAI
jgi:hypothetical protein